MPRTYTYMDGLSGKEIVRMTMGQAEAMSHSGDCEDDVIATMPELEWIGTLDDIRADLKECGAWDDLETADEETLRTRAAWIAAGSISESPDTYRDDTKQATELRAAILGGPGLDGYAYNADTYCVPCGRAICEALAEDGELAQPGSPEFSDSERQPQPIFFGESPDNAQHCAECGHYLYGETPEHEEVPEETETEES